MSVRQLGVGRLDGGARAGPSAARRPPGPCSAPSARRPAASGASATRSTRAAGSPAASGRLTANSAPAVSWATTGSVGATTATSDPEISRGERGMAAGGAEPVAVDPTPAHDLDTVRSRREADEPGPGPEPGGGHVEGGGHHFVGRRGGGDGDQRLGQGQAVLVAAARTGRWLRAGRPGRGRRSRPGCSSASGSDGWWGAGVPATARAATTAPRCRTGTARAAT